MKNKSINYLKISCVFVIIELNKEDCGLSAHNWSSQMRVGSLSRIGFMTENKGTSQKKRNAPGI